MQAVCALLEQTLSADDPTRRAAETSLKAHATHHSWPTALLFLLTHTPPLPNHIRLASVLALKRATSEHWHYDDPSSAEAGGAMAVPSSPYPEPVKAQRAWDAFRAPLPPTRE
jgi:hypothetical protein